MDGKKRIARVRNEERWKRLGFEVPLQKKDRIKAIAAKPIVVAKFPPLWMRDCIAQIVPENPNLFKNPRLFIERLQKRGYMPLGSGCYSTVLAKPNSDRVIKVTRQMDNWIDYIQWAAQNGHAGKLAPRVYSWKRHGDWAVAIVERMEKTTYSSSAKDDESLIMNLLYPARSGNIMAKLYMEDLVPGSVKFFDGLSKEGFDGDIGGGNVMLRKDGTLCVTDPCAGHIRTSAKRFRSGELSPLIWIYSFESGNRYRSQWVAQPYRNSLHSMQRYR